MVKLICIVSYDHLLVCVFIVASPCQLGCSGMQFCRNFNNRCVRTMYSIYYIRMLSFHRPSQSFRQCTTTADRLAKNSYYSWIHNGRIVHPLVTLLVGNVAECLPEAWKVISCHAYFE